MYKQKEQERKRTALTSEWRLYVGKCYTRTANRLTIKSTGTEPMEHIKQSNKQTNKQKLYDRQKYTVRKKARQMEG